MKYSQALKDANGRLQEWHRRECNSLEKAIKSLSEAIGSECECDNTHEANKTRCCLCEYAEAIEKFQRAHLIGEYHV